ncbi:helix-turn-helix domain-containing protein, partial [Nocardia farcinica]|nr:helix-turn-helix domain-containing protein [Nocardia farcinica]
MTGSTLPRRALGRRLRELRERANKSQLAAGTRIEVSKQTIGRVEVGRPARISTAQYRELLDLYGASEAEREEVLELHREVRAINDSVSTQGWWRAYSDVVNPHFDHYMSLEQASDRVTAFQLTLLPGLVQTVNYRRWIESTTDPAVTAVDVERRLELLARRQQSNSQILWIGSRQATSDTGVSGEGSGVMSTGRSRSLPLWNTAP